MTQLIAPVVDGQPVGTKDPLVYWKQILPNATVHVDGQDWHIDDAYLDDLVGAFKQQAVHQTCLQLATPDNAHGHDFDPERQRAEAVEMVKYADLPESVKNDPNIKGRDGLYAKLRFFSKAAAKSVHQNPNLGVSARLREDYTDPVTRKTVKRAVVHILGTIDPRITGMAPWRAADLAWYPDADEQVIDLSNGEYRRPAVPKTKTTTKPKPKAATTDDLDGLDLSGLTDEQLAQIASGEITDEQLAEIVGELDPDGGDDADADEDEDEDSNDDEEGEPAAPAGKTLQEVALSVKQQRAVDLANATAASAQSRADEALRRAADAEWRERRNGYLLAGVPPADLDLAAPVLNRAFPMVLDLSNEVGGDSELDVSDIVTKLLDSRKGTIDMSVEKGHGGLAPGEKDPDEEALAAWDAQYPVH